MNVKWNVSVSKNKYKDISDAQWTQGRLVSSRLVNFFNPAVLCLSKRIVFHRQAKRRPNKLCAKFLIRLKRVLEDNIEPFFIKWVIGCIIIYTQFIHVIVYINLMGLRENLKYNF